MLNSTLSPIATLPPSALSGSLDAISSKSDLHRLILCAALSPKASEIRYHAALSKDIEATVGVLRALGAEISVEAADNGRSGKITALRPVDPESVRRKVTLDCGESGSTARFILPLAALYGKDVTITGSGKLPERPFEDLCVCLEAMGARFSSHKLPIRVEQTMKPHGFFEIRGDVSSQYITGLLFILPLCKAAGIRLTTPLASAGYVELTGDALRCYGVAVEWKDNELRTTGSYTAPSGITDAQGDWSNAAFWLAAAKDTHKITLNGLRLSSQPDRRVLELLSEMGMKIETHGDSVCASAPGYDAEIRTTGGTIWGYWSTGNSARPMKPTITMMMDSTVEKTGLSIKKSAFIGYCCFSASSSRRGATGSTFMPCWSLW